MKYVLLLLFMCLPFTVTAQTTSTESDSVTSSIINVQGVFGPIRKYSPPLIYNKWWRETMQCAHKFIPKSQRDKVEFSYVFANAFVLEGKWGPFSGYTFAWDDRIFIIMQDISEENVVKHEMMHYILYHNGIMTDHPKQYFKRCGLEVS